MKFKTIIQAVIVALFLPLSVKAEDLKPTITQDTGTVTIRYFDDIDETIPVTGAKFEIYKVADIGRGFDDNGQYIPLIDNLDFAEEEDAIAYEDKVLEAYEAEDFGYKAEVTVGEDGTGLIENVPVGAYFVREVDATRYHIRSKPFLISVPETNETQNSWNFNVIVNPKSTLAGDLKLTKKLSGNAVNHNDTFNFEINIGDMPRMAEFPDGSKKEVKTGDVVTLKENEVITILDIPEGTEVSVKEIQKEEGEYVVSYENNGEKIIGKDAVTITVTNTKNQIPTGVKNALLLFDIAGITLAMLVVVIYLRRKEKRRNMTDSKERRKRK